MATQRIDTEKRLVKREGWMDGWMDVWGDFEGDISVLYYNDKKE
jgi:hypothetical protein